MSTELTTIELPASAVLGGGEPVKEQQQSQRSFRPSSKKLIEDPSLKYTPLTWTVGDKIIPIGCGNDVEDIGLIIACYVAIWSTATAMFALLLKAAIDTDDQSTALHAFLFLGVMFFCMVSGSVMTGQMEIRRVNEAREHRREEALKKDGVSAIDIE